MLNILDILGDFWFCLSLLFYSTLFGPWIISVICSSNESLGLYLEPFQCCLGQLHSPGDSEAPETLPVQPGCWCLWVWQHTRPGRLSVTGWRTRISWVVPADEAPVARGWGLSLPWTLPTLGLGVWAALGPRLGSTDSAADPLWWRAGEGGGLLCHRCPGGHQTSAGLTFPRPLARERRPFLVLLCAGFLNQFVVLCWSLLQHTLQKTTSRNVPSLSLLKSWGLCQSIFSLLAGFSDDLFQRYS